MRLEAAVLAHTYMVCIQWRDVSKDSEEVKLVLLTEKIANVTLCN